jgi:hypothetical protein
MNNHQNEWSSNAKSNDKANPLTLAMTTANPITALAWVKLMI